MPSYDQIKFLFSLPGPNHIKINEILLTMDISSIINQPDFQGRTPAHTLLANLLGHDHSVSLFKNITHIRTGANLYIKDVFGKTPFTLLLESYATLPADKRKGDRYYGNMADIFCIIQEDFPDQPDLILPFLSLPKGYLSFHQLIMPHVLVPPTLNFLLNWIKVKLTNSIQDNEISNLVILKKQIENRTAFIQKPDLSTTF